MSDAAAASKTSAKSADAARLARRRSPVRALRPLDHRGAARAAVWKLAWPTMLTNIFGGLQGLVDHIMVGHLVGYAGNAAIGVAWQIFVIVIVFINSLFTGMSVLVARFAGAGEEEKVDRTVYQAFLTAIGISLFIMAPLGYVLSPYLLDLVHAAPNVKTEALPFLRIMFLFGSGMLVFYMLGGALRSAGDARTPMMLGVATTLLNIALNVVLIRGLGPIPSYGTKAPRWARASRHGSSPGTRWSSSGVAAGWCRSRAAASAPTGRSSASCSASGFRAACRASR